MKSSREQVSYSAVDETAIFSEEARRNTVLETSADRKQVPISSLTGSEKGGRATSLALALTNKNIGVSFFL